MKEQEKPTCEATSSQDKGEVPCESTAIQEDVTKGSVSHAISPVISPNTSREQLKTETLGNKSGDKSCNKPDCYKCCYRGDVEYSAHSCCNHPYTEVMNGAGKFISVMYAIKGLRSPIGKRLNLTYSQHGFNNGWFMWPINFDPVWLESCDGFKES